MVDLRWDGNDFRNSRDSSGATADQISHSGKLQQGYQHGSTTRGLVAYYPMEKGEGEVLHDGALNNLGQIDGASWNGSGQIGSDALSFDGTSSYVEVEDSPELNFSKGWSISAWFKPRSFSNSEHIVRKAKGQYFIRVEDDSRLHGFTWNGSDWPKLTSSLTLNTGNWYLGTLTYDGSTLKLYLNQSKEDETTATDQETSGTLDIGWSSYDNGNYFDGLIDEVRIYDRPLSQPEIQALYNLTKPSGVEVTESDVPSQGDSGVSRYTFDGDVNDSWGTNDGTDNTSAGFVNGVYGQANDFDGNDDYISLGKPSNLEFTASDSFTVSHWIYTRDLSSDRHHIISTRDGDNNWIWTGTYTDGNLEFRCKGDSNSNYVRHNISTNSWFHIVGKYDGNDQVSLYVNGEFSGSDSSSSLTGSFVGSENWELGRRQNSSYRRWYNGLLDDVRIYDTALSPRQVERLYNLGAWRIKRGDLLQ